MKAVPARIEVPPSFIEADERSAENFLKASKQATENFDDESDGRLDGLGHGPRQYSCRDRLGIGGRGAREISQVLATPSLMPASALTLDELSNFFGRSKNHRRAVANHAGAHDSGGAFWWAVLTWIRLESEVPLPILDGLAVRRCDRITPLLQMAYEKVTLLPEDRQDEIARTILGLIGRQNSIPVIQME